MQGSCVKKQVKLTTIVRKLIHQSRVLQSQLQLFNNKTPGIVMESLPGSPLNFMTKRLHHLDTEKCLVASYDYKSKTGFLIQTMFGGNE